MSHTARAPRQLSPDCSVDQIEHQIARQIELPARLGSEGSQTACCTRLPDWALYQIGQVGFSARLPDWSVRQVGFSARLPDWSVRQVGQVGFSARLPDWSVRQIGRFLPHWGPGCAPESLFQQAARLDSMPDCFQNHMFAIGSISQIDQIGFCF